MLCCAVLCCAVLCCAVLCCGVMLSDGVSAIVFLLLSYCQRAQPPASVEASELRHTCYNVTKACAQVGFEQGTCCHTGGWICSTFSAQPQTPCPASCPITDPPDLSLPCKTAVSPIPNFHTRASCHRQHSAVHCHHQHKRLARSGH